MYHFGRINITQNTLGSTLVIDPEGVQLGDRITINNTSGVPLPMEMLDGTNLPTLVDDDERIYTYDGNKIIQVTSL